jgi:hypothetical protein
MTAWSPSRTKMSRARSMQKLSSNDVDPDRMPAGGKGN